MSETKKQTTALDVESTHRLDALRNISDYDCGLMNGYGGGQVNWWHNYIRYEVDRCNKHWREEINAIIE